MLLLVNSIQDIAINILTTFSCCLFFSLVTSLLLIPISSPVAFLENVTHSYAFAKMLQDCVYSVYQDLITVLTHYKTISGGLLLLQYLNLVLASEGGQLVRGFFFPQPN